MVCYLIPMYRLLYFLPIYLIFLLFRTLTIILGWVLIPPMAVLWKYTAKEEISMVNGRTILNWKSKLLFPWSNQEDGILAGAELKGYPNWVRIIYWSAIRNPANNLRFIEGLSCKIEKSKVEFIGSDTKDLSGTRLYKKDVPYIMYDMDQYRFTTLTWQGLYSNLRIQFKMFGKIWRFWIGWKIYPHDKLGINSYDYRYKGAGFATQFKRIYPRNNK